MGERRRIFIKEPDVFDILSATWILACNDENPLITYEGIKYRLNLPNDYNVKGLIQSRGELFRRGVPQHRLREWKQEMLQGHHVPTWIREVEDATARKAKIETLTPDDVFRSQFRADRDAPRSSVEIISWGLEHIDRLRKASLEWQEQEAKGWQMWLVFAVGVLNIIITVAIALRK